MSSAVALGQGLNATEVWRGRVVETKRALARRTELAVSGILVVAFDGRSL